VNYQVATWILAWVSVTLAVIVWNLMGYCVEYKAAFHRVATQLYNMTQERDELRLRAAKLSRELTEKIVQNDLRDERGSALRE